MKIPMNILSTLMNCMRVRYARIATISLVLSILCASISTASHESPGNTARSTTVLSGKEIVTFPTKEQLTERNNRYFGTTVQTDLRTPRFTVSNSAHVSVSPTVRAYQSLGPLAHPDTTLQPQKTMQSFTNDRRYNNRFSYLSLYGKTQVHATTNKPRK